jgi:gamma-glutamyltranspeptidase/glutathione hydrolase
VDDPTAKLLDPAYVAKRGATIRDDRATPSSEILPGVRSTAEGLNTLHLSVADSRGGAVALSTTLNSWFGAAIVVPGTGILLNNEMDDFSLAAGVANQYNLLGEAANAVAAGKRPLSSMCPTIVEAVPPGERPLLVLGSRGGPTIISSVLQTILHAVDDGYDIQEAVDTPRIHHQWQPDVIYVEPHGLAADVATGLTTRGHALKPRVPMGSITGIGLDARGYYLGAVDGRDEPAALGY